MGDFLGLVSIGQSPRPDYVSAFQKYAPGVEVRVVGALDDFSVSEIQELAAKPASYPLLTRLADGSHVEIDLALLSPLVNRQAISLSESGAGLIVVMCAGGFPDVTCGAPVILPGKVLPAVLAAVCTSRRIGIVTPVKAQAPAAEAKWREDGFTPIVTWAAPHDTIQMRQAAKEMCGDDLEVVVLDCMGHDESYRTDFARLCGRPTLLAQSLVARIAGEWVTNSDSIEINSSEQ
jgi:protein AroM